MNQRVLDRANDLFLGESTEKTMTQQLELEEYILEEFEAPIEAQDNQIEAIDSILEEFYQIT